MLRLVIALSFSSLWAQPQHAPTLLEIQGVIESGDFKTASQLIETALSNRPNDAGVLNLRGVIHARQNELAAARADFSQAVQLNPQLTPAWQNLARACQQLNETNCSLEAWGRVLRSKPADAEAHSALAQLYADKRQFADSLRQLKESQTDNLLLRCYDLCGLQRIPEAKTTATRLAKQPDFTEADFASLHGPLDNSKSAAIVAVLAEGLDARNAAGLPTLQRLALAYEQLNRVADARKTLERVALLDPNNTAHLLELARLAELTKDHEGALGYLAHARDLTPNVARIHFLFGVIAGELNLPIEAKQSLDKALTLEPDNPEFNYAMGSVILTTRDAATAASYFAKFVKARPSDARGHFALGLAYFASGDYPNATQEMQTSLSNSQVAPFAEYYLGRIARLEGNLAEAVQHLHAALAARPKFAEPHTELARIALEKGETERARTELQQALQLTPDDFQTNEQLLILYKRTHDSRSSAQAERLKTLDEQRSKRAELMLRTLEMRP